MASCGALATCKGPLGGPSSPATCWDVLLGALVALARMEM